MSIRSKYKDAEFVASGCANPVFVWIIVIGIICGLLVDLWRWFIGLFNLIVMLP